MASMAARQIAHFDAGAGAAGRAGCGRDGGDAALSRAVQCFSRATPNPRTGYEGLVWAYVGDGFAADFYREVAAFVDPDTRALVHHVLADDGQRDFVIEKVRGAIAADPELGGRLALWGRRLVGEALSQAQRVAADRDALTSC